MTTERLCRCVGCDGQIWSTDDRPLCFLCVRDMFGGTFHGFEAFLESRPDLADAGTARQLDEYADHERRSEAILRATRAVAEGPLS